MKRPVCSYNYVFLSLLIIMLFLCDYSDLVNEYPKVVKNWQQATSRPEGAPLDELFCDMLEAAHPTKWPHVRDPRRFHCLHK